MILQKFPSAAFVLADLGLEIEEAPDGLKAYEMVRNSPPGYYDAVFMDIQMPVMDGYEATEKIRKLLRPDLASIPIIAMTANAFDIDRKKALDMGMNEHLSKPIDIRKIRIVLQKIFRQEENKMRSEFREESVNRLSDPSEER